MTLDKKVDFPTEGKPTREIRASPLLLTSKPEPPPPPAPGPGSNSCARKRASFLDRLAAVKNARCFQRLRWHWKAPGRDQEEDDIPF